MGARDGLGREADWTVGPRQAMAASMNPAAVALFFFFGF